MFASSKTETRQLLALPRYSLDLAPNVEHESEDEHEKWRSVPIPLHVGSLDGKIVEKSWAYHMSVARSA